MKKIPRITSQISKENGKYFTTIWRDKEMVYYAPADKSQIRPECESLLWTPEKDKGEDTHHNSIAHSCNMERK